MACRSQPLKIPVGFFVGVAWVVSPSFGQTACEVAKLLAPDGSAGDFLGHSVSASGNAVVLGAPRDDDNGPSSGSVYVFRDNGSAWVQEQKVLASDGGADDGFGWSIAARDDVAVVGAMFQLNDNGKGAAYIFRHDGSSWVEEQKLWPSTTGYNELGNSVALSDNVALIGAWFDTVADVTWCGSAYVFRFNGSSWVEEQRLVASDATDEDHFGDSVALSGNVALIGTAFDDDNGVNSGSAYVFRHNGSSWVQEQKLLASDGAAGAGFGGSTALSGDVALIGARGDNGGGLGRGAAYVFRYNGSMWVQEQKLLAADGTDADHFGDPVSLSGNVALVGTARDGDNGVNSGSAYVFRDNGSTWVQEQKLLASDGADSDFFGASLSGSGDVVVVGAFGDDGNTGSAYVYEMDCSCPWDCEDVPDGSVGITDFLKLVGDWGGPSDCDVDGSGVVGINDFLELVGQWGPCP